MNTIESWDWTKRLNAANPGDVGKSVPRLGAAARLSGYQP
jgi:hypothetical protein